MTYSLFIYLHISTCPSVYFSAIPCGFMIVWKEYIIIVFLSISEYVSLHIYLSLFVCLCVFLLICLSIYLFLEHFVLLSIYQFVLLSLFLLSFLPSFPSFILSLFFVCIYDLLSIYLPTYLFLSFSLFLCHYVRFYDRMFV